MDAKLTAEWCEERAREWEANAKENVSNGWRDDARDDQLTAHIYRITAATLRWYERTETGGDDHAERQAMIAACKEATSGDT